MKTSAGGIVPEEPERRADERSAEHGELPRLRHERDLEVASATALRDVREERIRAGGDAEAPIARPSRPSVRLTAFDAPTRTTATKGM